jgi:hypothetical protein
VRFRVYAFLCLFRRVRVFAAAAVRACEQGGAWTRSEHILAYMYTYIYIFIFI